jgi:hypothetical protein
MLGKGYGALSDLPSSILPGVQTITKSADKFSISLPNGTDFEFMSTKICTVISL